MFVRERKRVAHYKTMPSAPAVANGTPATALRGQVGGGESSYRLQRTQGEALYAFAPVIINAIRYMTTRLMATNELPKCCAVVSALREEGVTYSALALALTLANDTARRVCYVDLNWYWPATRLQGMSYTTLGVATLLTGETNLAETLIPTNYNNLALLLAGNLAMAQRPVVARSAALPALLAQLREQFDHLILDIPAILTTSDAIPLASLGDAACVVVRHGVSTSQLTRQALQQIDHVPTLGVILNRTQSQTPSWLLKWIGQE